MPLARNLTVRAVALRLLVVVALLGGSAYWSVHQSRYHFTKTIVSLPQGVTFSSNPAQFAVSPDGQQLAMNLTSADGKARVWSWQLDNPDARPLGGTEGVTAIPAWAPDGQNIAFVVGGKLRRVPVAGGAVETICEVSPDATLDWGKDGTILFANGGTDPLRRIVAASGGAPQQITKVFPDERHMFPKFVPGANRFLFSVLVPSDPFREGVWMGSFDGGKGARLLPGTVIADVAGDFIVYSQDTLVVAQRFAAATGDFSGMPVTLADHIRVADNPRRPAYSVSPTRLAFQSDDGVLHLLTDWPALLQGQ